MPDFNLPDPTASDFNEKVVQLLSQLFDKQESATQRFQPISTPQDGLQVGSVWIDQTDGKMRINTESGVRIVQFEP